MCIRDRITMIETDLNTADYDAYVIAPLQAETVKTLVAGETRPVIAVDSDIPDTPEVLSFVGTGNEAAAKLGGQAAVELSLIHIFVLYFLLQFYLRYQIPFLENTHYLYFTAFLFIIDMIIMCIIVKVHPRETDFVLHDAQAVDLTPWKNGKYVAAFVLAIMCLAYVVFSPLCLGA